MGTRILYPDVIAYRESRRYVFFCEETTQFTAVVLLYVPLYYFYVVLVNSYTVNRLFSGKWQRSQGQRAMGQSWSPARVPPNFFPEEKGRDRARKLSLQTSGVRRLSPRGAAGDADGLRRSRRPQLPRRCPVAAPRSLPKRRWGREGPGGAVRERRRRSRPPPQAELARAASRAGSGRAAEGRSFTGARGACALRRRVRGSGGGRGAEPGTRQRSAVSVQARPPFSLSLPVRGSRPAARALSCSAMDG